MAVRTWTRFQVTTALTFFVSCVWMVGLGFRIFSHLSLEVAPTLDAAMLLILGYWFSTAATSKDKNGGV
jgi:putative flippase GtrA